MQWLFDIIIEMMENAGFIRIGDVETYLQGMIVMWSGDENDIPAGWALCDGTQGTPNMTARFVLNYVGPGTTHATGGAFTHDHDFTGDGHRHELPVGPAVPLGAELDLRTDFQPAVGTTDVGTHLPPYYILAFIMKL